MAMLPSNHKMLIYMMPTRAKVSSCETLDKLGAC
jgi:hypothetical protein